MLVIFNISAFLVNVKIVEVPSKVGAEREKFRDFLLNMWLFGPVRLLKLCHPEAQAVAGEKYDDRSIFTIFLFISSFLQKKNKLNSCNKHGNIKLCVLFYFPYISILLTASEPVFCFSIDFPVPPGLPNFEIVFSYLILRSTARSQI